LIRICTRNLNCYLNELQGPVLECVVKCIGTDEETIKFAEEKIVPRCIINCLSRQYNIQQIIQLVAKCRVNINCWRQELQGPVLECVIKCIGTEEVVAAADQEEIFPSIDTCTDSTTAARARYARATNQGKELIKRGITLFLATRYGRVSIEVIVNFVNKHFLNNNVTVAASCAEFRKIFQSDSAAEVSLDACTERTTLTRLRYIRANNQGKELIKRGSILFLASRYPRVTIEATVAYVSKFLLNSNATVVASCAQFKKIYESDVVAAVAAEDVQANIEVELYFS